MAYIEELLTRVEDEDVRAQLGREVKLLKKRTRFGLVYERHLPETVLIANGIKPGEVVRRRAKPESNEELRVVQVRGKEAVVQGEGNGKRTKIPLNELFVVKAFGEPVFPSLNSVGSVKRSKDGPNHIVVDGENFHALQLLGSAYEGKVDLIYCDPPYNTGARDWKYNNRYVDESDNWRHSKWLSFMEKRLRLAKRLLKPDGVLVVTIDEHEVHHLGVLLEDLFPEATRQLITIVINPKGGTEARFSRVEEYANFCFLGDASVAGLGDDLLAPLTGEEAERESGMPPRWKGLLRSGTDARRQDRKDMFFPVLIDPDRGAVLGTGDPLPYEKKPDFKKKIDRLTPVWPVRRDGSLGRWGVGHINLRQLIQRGYVALGSHDPKRSTWGITYLSRRHREQIEAGLLEKIGFDKDRNVIDVRYSDPESRRVKRVWHRSSHDAGAGGSDLLRAFLGGKRLFEFPKSLYAVRDTLAAVVGTRTDAVVLDFFAGSATTLHATAFLNSQDGGKRQCILVTNNELDEDTEKSLRKRGLKPGDPDYEAHGIFEAVAKPRCEALLTGKLPDGKRIEGTYLDGRPYGEGFEENCEFFRLEYLDPDQVELRQSFEDLHAYLWLIAGARGSRPKPKADARFFLSEECGYAVLLDETALRDFQERLAQADGVEHLFIVTDSDDAFAEMSGVIGEGKSTHMLYGDYLRQFRRGVKVAA